MSIPDSAVSQNQQVQLTTIELMMALFGSARGLTIHGELLPASLDFFKRLLTVRVLHQA